jgi:murein DD-endopeptidase MepM/ murein hydrolase activator NlpD
MINIPYLGCKRSDITQAFGVNPNPLQPNGHEGVDFCPANAYGKILVAPEDVVIKKVIRETVFNGDFFNDLQKGFGLTMTSLENPNITYLYWHCMQVIPVQEGQTVFRGQMVAQMGNSGMCYTGGVYVPLASRGSGRGSHLHFERRDATKEPDYTDPLPEIDFSSTVTLSWSQNAQQVLQGISNLLSNKK